MCAYSVIRVNSLNQPLAICIFGMGIIFCNKTKSVLMLMQRIKVSLF